MMSKILNNSIRNVDYLTFIKHYTSELKFMSPWTQMDSADQSKLPKYDENVNNNRKAKNNSIDINFIRSK